MVILGEVELRRGADLGGDGAVAGGTQPLLKAVSRGLGGTKLLRRIGVDRRAVLRANVVALAHPLGRVVAFPEHLEERVVAGDLGVEHHQHRLGMAGLAAAHLLVGRV